jgi:hypothetical protein
VSRRAAKIDGNQGDIVAALEAAGASVQSLAAVGAGCPDILIGYRGVNYAVEIKDPTQAPSDRRLTPMQKKWHAEWQGKAHLVETVEQALLIVGAVKQVRAA